MVGDTWETQHHTLPSHIQASAADESFPFKVDILQAVGSHHSSFFDLAKALTKLDSSCNHACLILIHARLLLVSVSHCSLTLFLLFVQGETAASTIAALFEFEMALRTYKPHELLQLKNTSVKKQLYDQLQEKLCQDQELGKLLKLDKACYFCLLTGYSRRSSTNAPGKLSCTHHGGACRYACGLGQCLSTPRRSS